MTTATSPEKKTSVPPVDTNGETKKALSLLDHIIKHKHWKALDIPHQRWVVDSLAARIETKE